ncbi:MAG: carboxypeptidase-like regulatory domain-containing protein [Candidatus Sericytochromatia bacterium]|nr:carboxypeptidase-like regulatory domain-containing protein [Candidatus Sericytochromatia bacterium]
MHRSEMCRAAWLVVAVVLGAGCQAAPVTVPTTEQRVRAATPATKVTEVSGAIRLPAQLVGLDARSLVGLDAGSLVGLDAGSLVGPDAGTLLGAGARARALLTASEEGRPLVGARVYLADAGGKALPGLPEALTDGEGRFSLRRVPQGLTYVVVAEAPTRTGKVARLTSLASTHAGAVEVSVGLGSTMLTAALVANVQRGLGRLDNAQMRAAAANLERKLDLTRLPDFTDLAAVTRVAQAMVAEDPNVQREVTPLQEDLAEAPVAPEEVASLVAATRADERQAVPEQPVVAESPPGSPGATSPSAKQDGEAGDGPTIAAKPGAASTSPRPTKDGSLAPVTETGDTAALTRELPTDASPTPTRTRSPMTLTSLGGV